jgi:serine/threonine protein kinase
MLNAGDRIGPYELIRELGEGGMGSVWLAKHPAFDVERALKIPHERLIRDQGFRDRFYKEAEAQLNLRHPNIVPAFELIDEGPHLALVLEYVPGTNLERRIYGDGVDHTRRGTPLPVEEAFHISIQILDALDHAHQKGWVHRDVKPSNILLQEPQGRALLTDFGVVRELVGRRRTATGTVLGTVWYQSPEEILRPRTSDHRSDVYSFGVVLYEMLAGRPPFDVEEDEEGNPDYIIRNKHISAAPPKLRTEALAVPESVENLVMIALKKEPDERYAGCGEFLATLQEAIREGIHLGGNGGSGSKEKVKEKEQKPKQDQKTVKPKTAKRGYWRAFWTALFVLAALALAGMAVYRFTGSGELVWLESYMPWYDPVDAEWSALNKSSSEDLTYFLRKYPNFSRRSEAMSLLREAEQKASDRASEEQWKIWNEWPKQRASDVRDYLRLYPSSIPVPQAQRVLNDLAAKEEAELRDLAAESPLKVPGIVEP